jgi:hypothetical protein
MGILDSKVTSLFTLPTSVSYSRLIAVESVPEVINKLLVIVTTNGGNVIMATMETRSDIIQFAEVDLLVIV